MTTRALSEINNNTVLLPQQFANRRRPRSEPASSSPAKRTFSETFPSEQAHCHKKKMSIRPISLPDMWPVAFDIRHKTPDNEARALFSLGSMTSTQEVLIRSAHPALSSQGMVSALQFDNGKIIWLLPPGTPLVAPYTHAGGREIHVMPTFNEPYLGPHWMPWSIPEPLGYCVFGDRLLTEEEIQSFRECTPGSIGVQIHRCGYVTALYRSHKDIRKCWEHAGKLESYGMLRVGYSVDCCEPTAGVPYGASVASRPDARGRDYACLGLKLDFEGKEVLTTVAHAFYNSPRTISVGRRQFTGWYDSIRGYLRTGLLGKVRSVLSSVAEIPQKGGKILGKEVYYPGTNTVIGVVSKTYDEYPSDDLPYPVGYRHDLVLISAKDVGSSLPRMIRGPGCPLINGWGDVEEALRGADVFISRQNLQDTTSGWATKDGHGALRQSYPVIAAAIEYRWERQRYTVSSALLWRTHNDHDSVQNYSGTAVCLGKRTDRTAKALVFQNFQFYAKPEAFARETRKFFDGSTKPSTPVPKNVLKIFTGERVKIGKMVVSEDYGYIKGGFLLPKEIRQSRIVMIDEECRAESLQDLGSPRTEVPERRAISGPATWFNRFF